MKKFELFLYLILTFNEHCLNYHNIKKQELTKRYKMKTIIFSDAL